MSRLLLRGLGKAYGANKVVDGVDLALEEGEFLIGNGAGFCHQNSSIFFSVVFGFCNSVSA